jgi:hypothetical protein
MIAHCIFHKAAAQQDQSSTSLTSVIIALGHDISPSSITFSRFDGNPAGTT